MDNKISHKCRMALRVAGAILLMLGMSMGIYKRVRESVRQTAESDYIQRTGHTHVTAEQHGNTIIFHLGQVPACSDVDVTTGKITPLPKEECH